MKQFLLIIAIGLIGMAASFGATCTGSASCRACTTCSSCGHCAQQGGTCGVCAGHHIRKDSAKPRSPQSKLVAPESPAPPPEVSVNPQECQRQVQQLKQENQRLRELLSQGNTNTDAAPVPPPASAYAPQTAAASGITDQKALTHWLTISSNKRHNSSCRWFEDSKGRHCRADEGIPCKKCGG
jgi:hypothetical protein